MAITVNEKVNPEIMLEDPKKIVEEIPLRPEAPRNGDDATARAARYIKDKLDRDRLTLENEERRARGPRVGLNIYYNAV